MCGGGAVGLVEAEWDTGSTGVAGEAVDVPVYWGQGSGLTGLHREQVLRSLLDGEKGYWGRWCLG